MTKPQGVAVKQCTRDYKDYAFGQTRGFVVVVFCIQYCLTGNSCCRAAVDIQLHSECSLANFDFDIDSYCLPPTPLPALATPHPPPPSSDFSSFLLLPSALSYDIESKNAINTYRRIGLDTISPRSLRPHPPPPPPTPAGRVSPFDLSYVSGYLNPALTNLCHEN